MWICVECGKVFEQPVYWEERHGLDTPPYEPWYGSPCCFENFAEAHKCDCCGKYITGEYIKTGNDKRYCENCYCGYELGEED